METERRANLPPGGLSELPGPEQARQMALTRLQKREEDERWSKLARPRKAPPGPSRKAWQGGKHGAPRRAVSRKGRRR